MRNIFKDVYKMKDYSIPDFSFSRYMYDEFNNRTFTQEFSFFDKHITNRSDFLREFYAYNKKSTLNLYNFYLYFQNGKSLDHQYAYVQLNETVPYFHELLKYTYDINPVFCYGDIHFSSKELEYLKSMNANLGKMFYQCAKFYMKMYEKYDYEDDYKQAFDRWKNRLQTLNKKKLQKRFGSGFNINLLGNDIVEYNPNGTEIYNPFTNLVSDVWDD